MGPTLEEQVQLLISTRDAHGEETHYDQITKGLGVKVVPCISPGKGKGLVATKDFEEDEVILDEAPLAAVQDTASAEVVQACQNCFAVLGPTLEAHLANAIRGLRSSCMDGDGDDGDEAGPSSSGAGAGAPSHFPVSEAVEAQLQAGAVVLPGGEEIALPPVVAPPNGMGWAFCSEDCARSARGLYPGLLGAGSAPADLDALRGFAAETNPVVLLAARVLARTLAAAAGMLETGPGRDAWAALLEAWRPFALGQKELWWELPVAGQAPEDAEQLRQDRREVCEVAAGLIRRCMWDPRFPALFDVRVVGSVFGMVELNNLGLVVKGPGLRWAEAVQAGEPAARADDRRTLEAVRQVAELVEQFGDMMHVEGTGFYALQSCCNHSCEPSAYAFKDDGDRTGSAVIRAMRPIKAGEEITISYVDEDAPLEERQDALLEYGFVCDCPKCSAEGRH